MLRTETKYFPAGFANQQTEYENGRISTHYMAPPSGLLGNAEEAAIMVASYMKHKG